MHSAVRFVSFYKEKIEHHFCHIYEMTSESFFCNDGSVKNKDETEFFSKLRKCLIF